MASIVLQVLDSAARASATTNPFLASSTVFDDVIKASINSTWTRFASRFCLAGFGLILFQAVFLLLQKIRLGTFGTVRFNKMGLLVINSSDVTTATFIVYASLTVAFFSVELAMEKDVWYEASAMVLFQCRFVFILIISWTYLWACLCRCAELLWESDCVSKMSRRNQETLRATVQWGMSIFILSAALVPIPITCWTCAKMFINVCKILEITSEVKAGFIAAARTYDPKTFSKAQLFELLIPAKKMLPALQQEEIYCTFQIKLYLALLTMWILIYIPSLFFSLRCLYKCAVLQEAKDAAAVFRSSQSQPTKISRKIRRQTNQLVFNALNIFLCVLVHYPVIIWLVWNNSKAFLLDTTWRRVCYYGLSIPCSITGNVALAVLNSHSMDLSRELPKLRLQESDSTLTTSEYRSTTYCKAFSSLLDLESKGHGQGLILLGPPPQTGLRSTKWLTLDWSKLWTCYPGSSKLDTVVIHTFTLFWLIS